MSTRVHIFRQNVPDSDLLADIRRVANVLGKSPTIDAYRTHGDFHPSTIARRFGSWTKALERAELSPTRSRINIDVADLLANIGNAWESLGRQPRYSDMGGSVSAFSAKTYANRFGSWTNALIAFSDSADTLPPVTVKPSARRTRHINWRTRFKVMERDGFRCVACGASPASNADTRLHIDHILHWSNGGSSEADNLRTLCEQCNIGRSNT